MVNNYSEDYLEHFGVKGQRWGIRRYQNFDGSLTQAGVRRYRSAVDKYNEKKAAYNELKKDKTISKYNKQLEKSKVNLAKKEANQRYDDLKMLKKADKGKVRYQNGERIRMNDRVTGAMNKIGGMALTAAAINHNYKIGSSKVTKYLAIGGLASIAGGMAAKAAYYVPNSEISAYYNHPSTREKKNK